MSLLNNALAPVALVGLCGLAFVLGAQYSSQDQTKAGVRAVAQRRAEEEAVRRSQQAARMEALAVRMAVAEARRAELAAAAKKAARAAAVAALPGDPVQGKAIYMPCATCHGMQGEGKQVFFAPRLAGMEPWYVRSQLIKFKERVRGSHPQDIYGMQMAVAATILYSEEALDNVVAYIASLELDRPVHKGGGNAVAGKEHYAVCVPCHGPHALGMEQHKSPGLTNQHAWYLEKQLLDFKNGLRGAHDKDVEGRQMVPIMLTVEDKAIADLIAYIQSL